MIPENIKHLSFCKMQRNSKEAFERQWTNNPYTAEQIDAWIKKGNNYGVLSGYNNLAILDADCKDYVAIAERLPATFAVRSSSDDKRHFYYFIKDFPKDTNKILFIDPRNPHDKEAEGGDIRFKGFAVVGPGSIHPSTRQPYKIYSDLPVSEISFNKIMDLFGVYFKTALAKPTEASSEYPTPTLSIEKVIEYYKIPLRKNMSKELFGPHPKHGSQNGPSGTNFSVNTSLNTWCCFRCHTGGGPVHLVAMMEDELECHECVKGSLKGEKFKKVAGIIKNNFGISIMKESKKSAIDYTIIANSILKEHTILFCSGVFYEYQECGVYKEIPIEFLHKYIKAKLGNTFCINKANEISHSIRVDSAISSLGELNKLGLLNCKNGMLDLDTFELKKHSPTYNSTIQLPVQYIPGEECPQWKKTLSEIFLDNPTTIDVIQEFFGLCLTKDTKYDKALFMLGEGRNGKSTLLYVFQHVLGEANTASVDLEMLDNSHYVADLFGKLVNVSIETSAKASINDAKFKSIISGDMLHADRKYGQPFDFRPFCKLIFALNNMPQVNDKTDAFFHRLLITKFNRQFKEEEQNRELKYSLVANELDGIFVWMLDGLKRLRDRGYFQSTDDMKSEADEYRKENNNVLSFVEDECAIGPEMAISKKNLYEHYVAYCKSSNLHPMAIKRFGKQLTKHFPEIKNSSTGASRSWEFIDISETFKFTPKSRD